MSDRAVRRDCLVRTLKMFRTSVRKSGSRRARACRPGRRFVEAHNPDNGPPPLACRQDTSGLSKMRACYGKKAAIKTITAAENTAHSTISRASAMSQTNCSAKTMRKFIHMPCVGCVAL